MDLDDLWQENKGWILGCVAGLLVFVIANTIINNTYEVPKSKRVATEDMYQRAELDTARSDKEELDATLLALRASMHTEIPEEFRMTGDPEVKWQDTLGRLRSELPDLAYNANVDLTQQALSWPTPSGAVEIERALIGLSLVDHTVRQLMAAHTAVVAADFEAIGLREISPFTPNSTRTKRPVRRRPDEGISPEELLDEVKIGFKFQADTATVHRFLENCRKHPRKVTFGSVKITHGRPGEPLSVTGEMIALSIQQIPTGAK